MHDIVKKNLDLRKKYHREFKMVFGIDLANYFDNITGFDVVKFDSEFVKPRTEESACAAVKRQWGDDAVALVMSLIGSADG